MILLERRVPESFNYFLIGDDHEGASFRHNMGWNRLCEMFSKSYGGCKKNIFCHHGDALEGITVSDNRYDPRTNREPIPLRQAAQVIENLRPLCDVDREGVLLAGNHEMTLKNFGNLARFVADMTGLHYGTCACKIHLVDKKGRTIFKHFASHGRKSINSSADDPIRRKANRRLILKRHLAKKAGDCALMSKGHTHQLFYCQPEPELFLTDDGKDLNAGYTTDLIDHTAPYIDPSLRWYVNTGCFLRLYKLGESGYGEMAEYDPTELGFAIVRVRDRKIVAVDEVRI